MNSESIEPGVAVPDRNGVFPAASVSALSFPPNFLWGTATSATQVEGHTTNEWTDFVAPDGNNCRRACDHYHRYREDIAWMQSLGIKAYRMSIEWSRLQSEPRGPLNRAELERYRDVLDCLRAADITPMIVLHHFSNPLWVYRNGGWTNPATIAAFEDFVSKLVTALRDRVRLWNTFNEPDTYASCSYLLGEFPPFHKVRLHSFRAVLNHMGMAHQRACELIRRAGSGAGEVEIGYTKNWTHFDSLKPNRPWDWFMAQTSHALFNRSVLKAFTRDGRNSAATFQGLNYYGRVRFHNGHSLTPARGRSREELARLGVHSDDMFERYPPGLETILLELHRNPGLPIYITEHGAACTNENFRVADLRANLTSVHRAISRGADVRGFFYWSLLDNFEWQFGYTKKFGLLAVDFADEKLPRRKKPSADVFQTACVENRVP
jgi:beta-glucosidase